MAARCTDTACVTIVCASLTEVLHVVGLERADLPGERGVVDCALSRDGLASWGALLAVPVALASIYGTIFKYMPELEWSFSYPAVLLLMRAICVTLYFVFRLIS